MTLKNTFHTVVLGLGGIGSGALYWLSRRLGAHYELAVEGTNLFDVNYQEIAGVAMPGAKWALSLAVR